MQNHITTMIGIDGGGTKTEFVLFAEKGNILKRVVLGASNPNSCGMEKTLEILETGINECRKVCPEVDGIFLGQAGFVSGNAGVGIDAHLRNVYPGVKIKCMTDIINVISSATAMEECTAVISGTGSIVYAKKGDTLYRTGGWGFLLDNAGSGYDIGRDALHAALAEGDGIGEKTLITELCEKRLGTRVWDSVGKIYAGGSNMVASFAPVVFEAYEKGDQIAGEIIERTVERLNLLINHSISAYGCGEVIVLSGSIVTKNEIVIGKLREKNPKLNFVVPKLPQVYGACVQCCKLCGVPVEEITENFAMDYERLE